MKVERLLFVWRCAATPKSQRRILPFWVRSTFAAGLYRRQVSSAPSQHPRTVGGEPPTFYVSVDDALAVEEREGDEYFADDEDDVLFCDRTRLHLQRQVMNEGEGAEGWWPYQSPDAASACKVHCDPEFSAVEVRAMVEGDVVPRSVPHLGEERDFLLDLGDVVVGRVEVDHLERDDEAGWGVDRLEDAAIGSLADELLLLEQVRRRDVRVPLRGDQDLRRARAHPRQRIELQLVPPASSRRDGSGSSELAVEPNQAPRTPGSLPQPSPLHFLVNHPLVVIQQTQQLYCPQACSNPLKAPKALPGPSPPHPRLRPGDRVSIDSGSLAKERPLFEGGGGGGMK